MLALATFSAVRSSNRSARVAEEALLTGLRPLLIASRSDDPDQKVLWSDQHVIRLAGGRAIIEESPDRVIYLAMGLRNAGAGIALLHGWYLWPDGAFQREPPKGADEFRRLTIDLYIPGGGSGYWEAAIRGRGRPRPARRHGGDSRPPPGGRRPSLWRPTGRPANHQPVQHPAGRRRWLVLPGGTPLEPRPTRSALSGPDRRVLDRRRRQRRHEVVGPVRVREDGPRRGRFGHRGWERPRGEGDRVDADPWERCRRRAPHGATGEPRWSWPTPGPPVAGAGIDVGVGPHKALGDGSDQFDDPSSPQFGVGCVPG